jgi:putative acetyltransferase
MLIIEQGDPRAAQDLLEASHALMYALYAPEDNFALSLEDLRGPDVHFFIARDGTEILGTGALVACGTYGEVKSMFTGPDARGKGVGAALLRQIEDHARALGLPSLKLETGEELDAAIRLYERQGFVRCGAFGDYQPCDNSVFMEKML